MTKPELATKYEDGGSSTSLTLQFRFCLISTDLFTLLSFVPYLLLGMCWPL